MNSKANKSTKHGSYMGPMGPTDRQSARPAAREEHIQAALTLVLDALLCRAGQFPGWCHTPNGARRDVWVGAALTGQGVKAGVPDVLIYRRPPARPDAVGVALELKTRVGKTSVDQERWLAGLEGEGWLVKVVHGLDEALTCLQGLGWDVDGALLRLRGAGWERDGDRMVRAGRQRRTA